jgi:hypothetical protein
VERNLVLARLNRVTAPTTAPRKRRVIIGVLGLDLGLPAAAPTARRAHDRALHRR